MTLIFLAKSVINISPNIDTASSLLPHIIKWINNLIASETISSKQVTYGHITQSYKDESDARSHRLWNVVGWLDKRRPTRAPGMQGDIGSQWILSYIQVFTKVYQQKTYLILVCNAISKIHLHQVVFGERSRREDLECRVTLAAAGILVVLRLFKSLKENMLYRCQFRCI